MFRVTAQNFAFHAVLWAAPFVRPSASLRNLQLSSLRVIAYGYRPCINCMDNRLLSFHARTMSGISSSTYALALALTCMNLSEHSHWFSPLPAMPHWRVPLHTYGGHHRHYYL
ncbi:hypothetical protein BOTBODRAFT_361527 [Botryobasidium botryosum FD-172 SS1]|uniref:Uncharacterized protein n=1 Tax=Botryobasidium botryosum (strain FD-172 SS1) TaxID=930990 RepID=A0A067MQH7_BOTB1|nr:hypothetical protein BOTBODRAFT_361527 [Botryobasidium botryosum FD-172 SS1]